jgi:hypothetical protein
MDTELMGLGAIILACAVIVIKALIQAFMPSKMEQFAKYYPVVLMAFAWVEKNIPDDYGAGDKDPAFAKMARKADAFLIKFNQFTKMQGLPEANPKMIEEAKKLASQLAFQKKVE